jgi:Na+-translocating ferredoxin:NAD+ oxidoreductase RnfG subunit
MRFKSGILLFFGLLSACSAFAQAEVDFKHKALVKALQKEGIDMSNIEEIVIMDSVLDSNPISGKYFSIKENNVSQYQYIYVGRVNSCRAGGCPITKDVLIDGDYEYFDYFILFDITKTVQIVKVFNYQASRGHEITAKGWLKQFIGHDGSESLQVDKNIDAVSGATISVYAITADVNMKTSLFKKLQLLISDF